MFQRISNSWELVKESLRVLQADKELLIFPVISSIGVVIVSLTFLLPMLIAGAFDAIFARGGEVMGFIVFFAFYIVQYTVIFFANTALVGAAMIRLRGGDPTVSDGLQIASKHFGAILGYALVSATVGMICVYYHNEVEQLAASYQVCLAWPGTSQLFWWYRYWQWKTLAQSKRSSAARACSNAPGVNKSPATWESASYLVC